LKSDTDQTLIAAVDSLRQHKPFLSSVVADVVLYDFLRRYDDDADVARPSLTAPEREIIQLLAEGSSNKGVAARLGVSAKTIETHRANVRKLRLR
jgi:DNA-binding NarL/FixJ family response regulator